MEGTYQIEVNQSQVRLIRRVIAHALAQCPDQFTAEDREELLSMHGCAHSTLSDKPFVRTPKNRGEVQPLHGWCL